MEERHRGEERRWNRGELRRSPGGEIGCGGGAEERLASAVARRRDWRRDGKEMENRKIGKSMVDGGVIGDDGGRWRDQRRWWTVA